MDKRGETIYAFAKALGLSQQTTDAYMNGRRKPSLDFIYRVCSVCKCSANYILGLPETQAERICATDEIDDIRQRADKAKHSVNDLLESLDVLSQRLHGAEQTSKKNPKHNIPTVQFDVKI